MKKTSTEHDRMKAALKQKGEASFGRAQTYAPGPNQGGPVVDPQGSGTEDTVPTVLASGEYVLPADTVEQVGVENLEALKQATHAPVKAQFGQANGGKVKRCADGGVIQAIKNRPRRIDEAVQADATGQPRPTQPPPKTIEQQTQEKIVQPAKDMVEKVKKMFGMADGGVVQTIKNRRAQIDGAVEAAVAPPPATPAAPAPAVPARPASSLDAQVEAQMAAARAKVEAAKPQSMFGRIRSAVGLANGGMVWGRPGDIMDPTKTGPSAMYQARTAGAYDPFSPKPQGGVIASPQLTMMQQQADQKAAELAADAAAKAQVAPAAAPAAAKPVRQTEQGWSYQNGRIAMAGGGKVPRFDEFGRPILNDAVSGPGAARPPGYTVQELPVEEIDYSKTRNPGPSKLGETVERFGSKPAQPVDPARLAGNAVADAQAAAKPAAPAAPAPKPAGVMRPVGAVGRAVFGAPGAGVMAATYSRDVGEGSDIVPGATRPGAFEVTPEAAALSDTDKYKLMSELNNPRTHPDRQAQIRELMIGKAPTPASDAPRTKSDFGNPVPTPAAAPAPAAPAAPAGPTPADVNAAGKSGALAEMGISVEQQAQPAVPADMRGQIVRDTRGISPGAAVNLGSYGVEGQQIFGRSTRPDGKMNDFVGVGNGAKPGGFGGSRGVDLGIKPGEVEQFKRDLSLGPRPDALRNPVAYKAWQDSKANQDHIAAQGQASMVKAQADFYKAINDGNKDAAAAAAARAEADAKRVADNAKGLGELAASFAAQGYFGDTDPKVAEATLNTIIATKPLKLKDGRTILFKDLSDRERADHVGALLAAAELQLGKKGLFSTVGSVTGQSDPKPLTVAQTVNQVLGGNLDAGNPFTDKYWSDGTGRAFQPGSAEVAKYLDDKRKRDQR